MSALTDEARRLLDGSDADYDPEIHEVLAQVLDALEAAEATIAALLAGTTNCARNLRNIGEAHADGDDPIIDGIILDSGVIPEASMSSLFIAAADALDDLAAVVEGER